jgi:HK97 family phage major capsid protein
MLGYRAAVSNQVPANLGSSTGATTGVQTLSAIIFGNFNDLIIGEWSGVDITVDPYSNSTSGTVRVVALQDVDVAVRHAGSFAAMKEVDAS